MSDVRTLTLREILWAAAAFLAVTIAIFWPTISHIRHAIVGLFGGQGTEYLPGDSMFYVWQLWWFRHAVLAGADPAFTHNLFALYPRPVLVSLDAFFAQAAGLPLQLVTSPLTAYNIVLIGSFILSGVTTYILASTVTQSRLARFTAGFIFTFSTFHFFRATGHLAEATIEWLPFCAWRMLLLFRRPSPLNFALAAVGLALVPLSAVYYGPYFAMPFVLVVVCYHLLRQRDWFTSRNVMYLVGCLAVASIITLAILRAFFHLESGTEATLATAEAGTIPYSADGAAFFLPNPANPIFGQLTAPTYAKMLTAPNAHIEQGVYLGWIALALAGIGVGYAFRGRLRAVTTFWVSVALFGLALAVGPQLHVAGSAVIRLPFYSALFGWPLLSFFRAPNRLVVVALLAVAMLASIGVEAIIRSLTARGANVLAVHGGIVLLLAASLAETSAFAMQYPAAAVYVSPIYDQIKNDSSNSLLLDLPVMANGYFEMLQTVHLKRLVGGGDIPRATPQMESSVTDVPYVPMFLPSLDLSINLLGARQFSPPPKVALKIELLKRNIHYVVFHEILDKKSNGWAMAFLRLNLGKPVYDGKDALAVWHI
ncbi:MAG: hypothetical protein JO033_22380 [Acidobacteriaceae bacterium]|nr:hypothetical protein [Acidobacteriaceae bacterium]